MARLIPELEAYRERLEDRASAWDESSDETLDADLARCEEQVRLLERSMTHAGLLAEGLPRDVGQQRRDALRKLEVLTQTRDLTAAYAHVLRGYRARRGSA